MDHLAFEIIGVMVITQVTGYLIWRDRDARVNAVSNALPIPNIVMIVSKWICLFGIIAVLQSALMFSGITVQFLQGFYLFEISTYLQILFIYQMTDYLLFGAVAMAIHIIVNQKYIGLYLSADFLSAYGYVINIRYSSQTVDFRIKHRFSKFYFL